MKRAVWPLLIVFMLFGGCSRASAIEELQLELADAFSSGKNLREGLASYDVYSAAGDSLQSMLDAYLAQCRYTVHVGAGSGTVVLGVPDPESIQQLLRENSGFQAEYSSLKKAGASKEELSECVSAYVRNTLFQKKAGYEEFSVPLYGGGSDGCTREAVLAVDNTLAERMQEFTDFKFVRKKDLARKNERGGLNYMGVTECSRADDFVCMLGKKKMLVSDVEVFRDGEALTELRKLSHDNDTFSVSASDTIYYVRYKISNLSGKKSWVMENAFKLVDEDGTILENTGFHVVGLKEKAKVKAGGRKAFSCCLVGPRSAALFWYKGGMSGARKFILTE